METKVKNLGLIAGMVESYTEPKNQKVLWYDLSIINQEGVRCPIKYYDLIDKQWKLLIQ